MHTIEVQGLHIAYDRLGSGPPLVLLHGILGDSRAWSRQLDALADEFTVVALDLPGCGQSDDPPETYRFPEYADCLARFIAVLGLRQPHVLGLSWGGVLALELYNRDPTLPRSLTLAGTYAGWAGSLPPEECDRRLQQCLGEAELPPGQFVPGWLPGLLTERAPQDLVDEVRAMMSEFHPAGYRVMAHAVAEADLRPVLPRIAVPTLLLYGDRDARSPLAVAEALRDAIRTAQLVVMPGVGHLSNVEAPERFNAEVRAFLRSLPG
jgi:pimeloyl-ACP methyl ester carboxylesterase